MFKSEIECNKEGFKQNYIKKTHTHTLNPLRFLTEWKMRYCRKGSEWQSGVVKS